MSAQYPEQISNQAIESSLRQWREHGGLHRLEGTKCNDCNNLYYPRRSVCPKCHSLNLSIFKFKGKGTILNFVKDEIPMISVFGFREHMPKVVCTVKLDEGPVILGELVDLVDIGLITKGEKVKTVIRKQSRTSNTSWRYGYKFVLDKNY
ncbi:Zn-ribbon domain-containing OB-fold protein [Clostridium butyricum]